LGDIKSKRDRLEAQRASLLNQLREVNENREKVDLEESRAQREYDDIDRSIKEVTNGEYAGAKKEVDKLRRELGMEETRSLESQLEEKTSKQQQQRRPSGAGETSANGTAGHGPEAVQVPASSSSTANSFSSPPQQHPQKRGPGRPPKHAQPSLAGEPLSDGPPPAKRPRGRPKGSKNKPKEDKDAGLPAGSGTL